MDGLPPNFNDYLAPSWPTAQCVVNESRNYGIPVPVTLAIMKTESGKPGSAVINKNMTRDLGVMQINEINVPEYAKKTGLAKHVVRELLIQNGCFSVSVALDILSKHLKRTGSLATAVAHYNSKTPGIGAAYLKRVESNLHRVMNGELPRALRDTPSGQILARSTY